ncbi:MAG: TIGR02757 family protein [Bacteroidia bacterium]|nr:TIGR02757 family protein [Bacteroidia bacterium]
MSKEELRDILELSHETYNRPDFIADDPVKIPHAFSNREDIEISGFLTALIAWGRRDIIIRSANDLLDRMDREPYAFVTQATSSDLDRLTYFVHRTFNGSDARGLVLALRAAYQQHGGLEAIFAAGIRPGHSDVLHAIVTARNLLAASEGFLPRTEKHLANPAKGSSAKRINMFLRWMVRQDRKGVDFGIWTSISPSQLICPLDVHTGNVGRQLGLLTRKQSDWKAALELTENLRQFCPEDPVKYDFSLFGLGVSGVMKN